MKVLKIKCSEISADPESNISRERMRPMECQEMASSIEQHGLQQPVIVKKTETGYKLIAGFRRFTAVSVNLGQEEIFAVVTDSDDPELINLLENIQRKDLTFWEECCALKKTFPEGTKITEMEKSLSKSYTWIRARWLVWTLPDEVIAQIEHGLLGYADVMLLIKGKVDAVVAAEKLIAGKAAGKNTNSMAKDITGDKKRRTKVEMQTFMTKCLEMGCMEAVQTLRYALGEIEQKTLYNWLLENKKKVVDKQD